MDRHPVILVLNGPNLNLLGTREPGVYGAATLAEVEAMACAEGARLGFDVVCRQSNHEGQLIDWLHAARTEAVGVVLNAGGYTHTSVAIRDAIAAISVPVVEAHLSNIHARESFRHHSKLAAVAAGVIAGFGPHVYPLAIQALARIVPQRSVA